MPETMVIVGNGVAGTTAAFAARDAGFAGHILLISKEELPLYARTRLPEILSGSVPQEKLIMADLGKHQDRKIDLRLRTVVESIDPQAARLTLAGGETIPYDRLLLATGSRPNMPSFEGLDDRRGVFALRTLGDALAIQAFAKGKQRAVCIGGGILGLEAAHHLMKVGLQVEVVEIADRLLPRQLDREGAATLRQALEAKGFRFRLGKGVRRFISDPGPRAVELADGSILPGDLFVVSAGVTPRRELADVLGLQVERGICIDQNGLTNRPGIFAAGDNVQFEGQTCGTWLGARFWGQRAGQAMAGRPAPYLKPAEIFRLKLTGIDLLSLGDGDLEGAAGALGELRSLLLKAASDEGVYQKVTIKGDRVRGAILIGPCPAARLLEKAILEGRDWAQVRTELGLDVT